MSEASAVALDVVAIQVETPSAPRWSYSPTSGGFYNTAIHGDAIPADAVAITDAAYAALMAAQSAGKRIVSGDDGHPAAVDRIAPAVTADAVKAEARRRLAPTDWYVIRKGDTGQDVPETVTAHRAAIRAASAVVEALDPIPTDYAADARWPALPAD